MSRDEVNPVVAHIASEIQKIFFDVGFIAEDFKMVPEAASIMYIARLSNERLTSHLRPRLFSGVFAEPENYHAFTLSSLRQATHYVVMLQFELSHRWVHGVFDAKKLLENVLGVQQYEAMARAAYSDLFQVQRPLVAVAAPTVEDLRPVRGRSAMPVAKHLGKKAETPTKRKPEMVLPPRAESTPPVFLKQTKDPMGMPCQRNLISQKILAEQARKVPSPKRCLSPLKQPELAPPKQLLAEQKKMPSPLRQLSPIKHPVLHRSNDPVMPCQRMFYQKSPEKRRLVPLEKKREANAWVAPVLCR